MLEEDECDKYEEPSAEALLALQKLMPMFRSTDETHSEVVSDEQEEEQEAEEFEYNLFSGSKPAKISIAEPVEAEYVRPTRPESYYKHTPIAPHILQSVVLSGQQVLEQSTVPWATTGRLIIIPHDQGEQKKRRWRPSMARRRKFKAIREQEEVEQKRVEARMIARSRGRGRGRGFAARGGMSRDAHKVQDSKPKTTGYPRKGAPPA